jgi:hypothetical protein
VSALFYSVLATNDARATLGGNPYDNKGRSYKGSLNEAQLNVSVARFGADSAATDLARLANYETDGLLSNPLVDTANQGRVVGGVPALDRRYPCVPLQTERTHSLVRIRVCVVVPVEAPVANGCIRY